MTTRSINMRNTVAGVIAVVALSASSAFAEIHTKGATKLMNLAKSVSGPISSAEHQGMHCGKCMDTTVAVKENPSNKGAGAKALLGTTPGFVSKHGCEGCSVDWKTTGHGKAKRDVPVHRCTSEAACCSTTAGAK